MTTTPRTPCEQNSEIPLAVHEERVQNLRDHLEMLEIAGAAPARIQAARETLAAKLLEHHPDHWYIDPGSGRETEDGRLRRRALQACWTDCPMRVRPLCLDLGLEQGPTLQYGIFGGYTEKQRQQIVAERDERRAAHEKGPGASNQ
jgi:hypothetical protein